MSNLGRGGFVINHSDVDEAIRRVEARLKPAVVHVRYDVANDWSGDLSIFFRVLLSDEASKQPQLRATVQKIKDAILKEVKPYESGLQAYFNYRSESEQREVKEESWA